MTRYGKNNGKFLVTSTTLRRDLLQKIIEYMEDSNIRNRSYAIEVLIEERLAELGYIEKK